MRLESARLRETFCRTQVGARRIKTRCLLFERPMPEQRCEWQSLSLRQRRLIRLIVLVGISSLLWWGIIWLLVHMLFSLVRIHFGAGAMLMTKRARCPTSIDAYRLDQMFTGAKPKMPQRAKGGSAFRSFDAPRRLRRSPTESVRYSRGV